jgi:hypothetical protein
VNKERQRGGPSSAGMLLGRIESTSGFDDSAGAPADFLCLDSGRKRLLERG